MTTPATADPAARARRAWRLAYGGDPTAKELAGALAHGDPARQRIVKNSLRGKLAEFINR
jgi:hypothetical protein